MTTIAKLENVTKKFGKKTAVRDVTQTIERGEVVGIIGPNGGGKSTLLYLIAGLLMPDEGTILIDDIPAHLLARKAAGRIGLVTARPGLYPLLTGRENLHYFASLFDLSDEEIESRSEELIDIFGLDEAMDQRCGTWSTGMQQRLSLIRALVTRPELLLFDEPTANLDPIGERELHEQLRAQADAGLACVLVTHRLEQAQAICDRVWFIDEAIDAEIELEPSKYEVPSGPLYDMWQRRA